MAERTTAKAKKPATAKPLAKSSAKSAAKAEAKGMAEGARQGAEADASPDGVSGADGALLAENARLKAELAEALERIADLELKLADAVNRIDRVIDSLHKLPK